MIAPMTKVQIAAPSSQEEDVLEFLQEEEILHTAEEPGSGDVKKTDTAYRLANVQFALEFIGTIRKRLHIIPKRDFKNMFAGKPAAALPELTKTLQDMSLEVVVEDAQKHNDLLNEKDAHVQQLEDRIKELAPWKPLTIRGREMATTSPVIHTLLTVTTHDEDALTKEIGNIPTGIWQEVYRETLPKGVRIYGELVTHKKDSAALQQVLNISGLEQINLTLEDDQTVADALTSLSDELASAKKAITTTLKQARELFAREQDLQFAYDALLHRKNREDSAQFITYTPHAFVISGWVPTKAVKTLRKKAEAFSPNITVEEVAAAKDEVPPVALVNSKLMQPFEAVTNVYGKPQYNELDPSPALSIFFLISFGLALTDAGYGLIMMAVMYAAERFFRLKREMRKMVRLLFYAGATTVILGALTGGWFGITLEELAPSPVRDALLSVKLIDPVSNPIGLLMVSFVIGIIQLIFAWGVRGYHNWNTGNRSAVFLDDIPWMTLVPLLLAWVGAGQGALPASLEGVFKWLLLTNVAFLVITQGRATKNPVLRLATGTLSLYGLVGFLSDTLSYSRLLALGLATGIIGLVVNLIAGMVVDSVPVIGVVLAVFVLIIGHVFNLGINALGAFIHSSRLQFVEFFPKFMEGGGVPYRPLGRVSRYVDNPREFS